MKSARQAILKAAKAAIDAELAANAISAQVLSVAEESEPLPYVHLGAITENDDGDKTDDRSDLTLSLTAFSASRDEAESIMAVIQERLTGIDKLTLDAPFVTISQELDIGLPTSLDVRSAGSAFGASIRVRYLINHS